MALNKQLEKIFDDEVEIKRKEMKETKELVLPIIKRILDAVHKENEDFGVLEEAHLVGSAFQNLKVNVPNEFDFTVPVFVDHEKLRWRVDPENPLNVTLTVDERILKPDEFRNQFKAEVERAIANEANVEIVSKQVPTVTLKIDIGKEFKVSVDLMLMFSKKLALPRNIVWPREEKWPSDEKIEKIKKHGVFATAKRPGYWKLSFMECEKELMVGMDMGGCTRKKCHKLTKYMRDKYWCPRGRTQALTSYHLKNVLFWECEKYPDDEDWDGEHLGRRFIGLLISLIVNLREGSLPLYFDDRVNLFAEKDRQDLKKIADNVESTAALSPTQSPVVNIMFF